ncbi:MAG TPA: hypothetical protein VLV55_03385 [Rhizomicrobium sp.]|nr:hypothetical protein [Rhizomicrobium sp.]
MTDTLPDPSRFVVLISHERSGSHFLTDLLVSTGQVRSFDEVCNFNAINPDRAPASFYRFRKEASATDPDILLRPDWQSMGRFMEAYFSYLATLAPHKHCLLDIKWGHVHNFEQGWWTPERRPFLFGWLERNSIPVINLARRDSLAATVSNLVAQERQVWHKKEGEVQPAAPVTIDVRKAVDHALLMEREREMVAAWVSTNNCFNVAYEDIAGDDGARQAIMTRLCQFLKIDPPAEFKSERAKLMRSIKAAVANYAELRERVALEGGGKLVLAD